MNANSIFRIIVMTATSSLADFAQSSAATSAGANLAPGQQVYDAHCAACHGSNGNGNGPAAVWLFPKPRSNCTGICAVDDYPAVLDLLKRARSGFGATLSASNHSRRNSPDASMKPAGAMISTAPAFTSASSTTPRTPP